MALDIQAFRAAANLGGNVTLQDNAGAAQLVRGTTKMWFKSLFNIGDARATNQRILNGLRDAINNDPRYAKVGEQAQALLGKLDTVTPLSGRKMAKIINTLDSSSVTANKTFNEGLTARRCNRQVIDVALSSACHERGMTLHQIPATLRNGLVKTLVQDLKGMAGNHSAPLDSAAVDTHIDAKVRDLFTMLQSIEQSELSSSEQGIVKGFIFSDNTMKTPAEIDHNIQIRQNDKANSALALQMSDVSSPQTPLQLGLTAALKEAGFNVVPTQQALNGLKEAVAIQIEKAGKRGDILVTAQQGNVLLARVIADFVDSYRTADSLPNPADAAYMRRAVLESSSPLSSAYIHELVAHAGDIAPQSLLDLTNMQTPKAMSDRLIQSNAILTQAFQSLPDNLKLEGNLGHQSFMTHVTGFIMSRAGLTQTQSDHACESLFGPAAQSLRAGLLYQSATSPVAAGQQVLLLAIHSHLAQQAGMDMETFMQRATLEPAMSKAELPLDARAMLPGFQEVTLKNITLPPHPAGTEAHAKRTVLEGLKNDWQHKFLDEMYRHIKKDQGVDKEPTFELDLVRRQSINLGGRPIPTSLEELPVSVQDAVNARFPQDSNQRTSEIKKAIVAEGYNRIATFLFGEGRSFAELSPVQKNEVYGLASLCSQRTLVPSFEALSSQFTSVPVVFANNPHSVHKDIAVTRMGNGDFAIRMEIGDSLAVMIEKNGTVMLNPDQSSREGIINSVLPQAELLRMAQRDWAPMLSMSTEAFSAGVFHNKNLPNEQLLGLTGMDMIAKVQLTKAD